MDELLDLNITVETILTILNDIIAQNTAHDVRHKFSLRFVHVQLLENPNRIFSSEEES